METIELDIIKGCLSTSKVKSQVGNVVGLLVSVGNNHVVNFNVTSSDSQNGRVSIRSRGRLSVVASAVFKIDSTTGARRLQDNIRARDLNLLFICSRGNGDGVGGRSTRNSSKGLGDSSISTRRTNAESSRGRDP